MSTLGIYVSVPFCKAKCTFCNFASDTFALSRMDAYTARLCHEIAGAHGRATSLGTTLTDEVDSLYFGGGTPSLLEPVHIRSIFHNLHQHYRLAPDAEITLECAPGQLSGETLEELLRQGMNRVSLGVQSFVDAESAAVGRLHTRGMCLAEIERLRAAGIANLNLDLIAGLPLQTEASWRFSVEQALATGAPHLSVYMLEVDEDSRLGREALGRGSRYRADQLPTDGQTADFYQTACNLLDDAGVRQYEISNFARPGIQSRHNCKYWQRDPYLGFGLDAHSMLRTDSGAVRFANSDDLDAYMADRANPFRRADTVPDRIGRKEAFEESLFLGLRLNEGVSLDALRAEFGVTLVGAALRVFEELGTAGLVSIGGGRVSLTERGRLVSNEVFERLMLAAVV